MAINKLTTKSKKGTGTGLGPGTHLADKTFPRLTFLFAALIVILLAGVLVILFFDAAPSVQKFGLSFLSSEAWDPVKRLFGALPSIYGTLVTSLIGLIIAMPVSLGAAIFLSELSPTWFRSPASFVVEMLAAIPSVIIGLWGLFVLVPTTIAPVERWLGSKLGFIPLFQGQIFGGYGYLAAGVLLALMIIPIITSLCREAMRAVSIQQREAMLALGATRWETIRNAVLPNCRSGLVGAIILGLGRALGETMAVLMVIGNSNKISASLFSSGTTIAAKIASEFAEADSQLFTASLVELALVLFAVTLIVNIIARLLVWRLTAVKGARE